MKSQENEKIFFIEDVNERMSEQDKAFALASPEQQDRIADTVSQYSHSILSGGNIKHVFLDSDTQAISTEINATPEFIEASTKPSSREQGKIGLSKWALLGGLLTSEEELVGQPEYEAWKTKTGQSGIESFYSAMTSEHARVKYNQGVAYSVYRQGDELTPLVHVGDFADEKGAIKALVTESGEAFAWNQEGKTLATRYESSIDYENGLESGTGVIRVFEKGIPPYRRPVMNQEGLEKALVDAEGQVTYAASVISAKQFLQDKHAESYQLFKPQVEHYSKTGPIVWLDNNIAVQDIGSNNFVAHDAESIRRAASEASMTFQDMKNGVKISYQQGQVIAEKPGQKKSAALDIAKKSESQSLPSKRGR